jgi:hypothetical protein
LSFRFIGYSLLALGASCSWAIAGQVNTPIGFGFANVCAGNQAFGSLPNPGDGFSNTTDQYVTCNTATGSLASVAVTNSGSWYGNTYSNSASASAAPGFIQIDASNIGETQAGFPGASAYAGWNDQVTIGNGTGTGLWVVPVDVHFDLTAVGSGALARVGVAAYQNHNFLQPYGNGGPAYSLFLSKNGGPAGIRNSAIAFGWDYQGLWFGADDYGPSDPSTLQNYTVNRTVYFVMPFTYGVPFEFGIYMGGVTGEIASGCCTLPNSATLDPPTLSWGGPGVVIDPGNNTLTNFSITSQSGYNYAGSAVPEPSTGVMLALGIGGAVWRRRKCG